MKNLMWIVVVIMLLMSLGLAQDTGQKRAKSDEPAVVMDSKEEAAAAVLLTFLSADEDDKDGNEIAESYLNTQLGLDPTDPKDVRDKARIKAAVQKYAKEMKKLNERWESNIPDKDRLKVTLDIKKVQQEAAAVFKGTKAFFKLKQIENAVVEKEN
jgi:hypothetical protein